MAAVRYDWENLKNEYLLSEIEDVQEFIRQKLGSDKAKNGGTFRATKGWKEDKQVFKAKIRTQVMAEQTEKLKDRERQTLEMAAAGENLVIFGAYEKLKKDIQDYQQGNSDYIKMSAVSMKELFNMFRTEQGKTLGSTNTNVTENADAAEIAKNLLTAEQEQAKLIDDILTTP